MGAEGVLRNHQGDMICAYSSPLGEGSNNQFEIIAAIFGLAWCIHLGYLNVIFEVDSELLLKWIKQQVIPPRSIIQLLAKLQSIIRQLSNFQCTHTLREANFPADKLSKLSNTVTTPKIYFNRKQLHENTKVYLHLDKMGMATFKRRKRKKIKEPP
ncbi:uncharacterized protein LOC129872476 [Solanum dulcamara]|uniref:uncharacterized protein LOC129872476 n=1 Tax=Solanum dulcamara TaxID=45834 RepID=UPI0024850D9E|nr:uncharacterized protein LOC129872476 [Solanum dulcamara]